MGRRRPPHRPRDQESADPDPALGGASEAQVPVPDLQGPRHLRFLHRHDRAPGRRPAAHRRRVLQLRPPAGPELRDRERDRGDRRRHHVAGGGARQGDVRARVCRVVPAGALRPAPDRSGPQQPDQERNGGDRGARPRRAGEFQRPHPGCGCPR